ncbi:MAG: phosphatase PAP2 family protein [Planctomycetota bacterium]|nr:phosphatase PAP2 family protein [Planctomycetota bacterium]
MHEQQPSQRPWLVMVQSAIARSLATVRGLFDWIGRHETSVLVAMLGIVLVVLLFVNIADEVTEGDTLKFDEWAVRVLRNPDNPERPIGPRWLAEFGRDLTALGGVAFLSMLTLTVCGFLWLRRMNDAMWLVLAATFGGLIVNTLLKHWFDRPRPSIVPHLSQVYSSSFPSGHSMLSATVFLTLAALLGRFVNEWRLKAYFLFVATTLTVLVGVSRVYMGVHYPTDVLAGWAAGLAWALFCWIVARYLQNRHAILTKKIDSE